MIRRSAVSLLFVLGSHTIFSRSTNTHQAILRYLFDATHECPVKSFVEDAKFVISETPGSGPVIQPSNPMEDTMDSHSFIRSSEPKSSAVGVALLAAAFTLHPQTIPSLEWSQTYGGSADDRARAVAVTEDGDLILAGETSSFGAASQDMYVVKTDGRGEERWSRVYRVANDQTCRSISLSADGGVVLAGSGDLPGSQAPIGLEFAVKVDALGEREWSGYFHGQSYTEHAFVWASQTEDGGYVFLGQCTGACDDFMKYHLEKVDPSGVRVWSRNYQPEGWWRETTISESGCRAMDGGYLFVGSSYLPLSVEPDVPSVLKTDSEGREEWSRWYRVAEGAVARCVIATEDGGYVIAGWCRSMDDGSKDMYLLKIDALGNEVWLGTYGGAGDQVCGSVLPAAGRGYILAGTTTSAATGSDVFVVRTDGFGNERWATTIGGPADEVCEEAACTPDGGYIVAGYVTAEGNTDFYLAKLSPEKMFDLTLSDSEVARGDSIQIHCQLSNGLDEPVVGTVYSELYLPDGSRYPAVGDGDTSWLLRAGPISLAPGQAKVYTVTRTVPKHFAAGSEAVYTCRAYCRLQSHDSIIVDEATFEVYDSVLEVELQLSDKVLQPGDSLTLDVNVGTTANQPLECEYALVVERKNGGIIQDTLTSIVIEACRLALSRDTATNLTYSRAIPGHWKGDYIVRAIARKHHPFTLVQSTRELTVGAPTYPDQQWSKTAGTSDNESAVSASPTMDGGYVLVGQSTVSLGWVGDADLVHLMKADSLGNEEWSSDFGLLGDDYITVNTGNWVRQTTDGGYILCGEYFYRQAYVVKTDSDGDEEWSRVWGDRDYGESRFVFVSQTADGGYVAAGETNSSCPKGSHDLWLTKIDFTGRDVWSLTYGDTLSQRCQTACRASDGGYLLVAALESGDSRDLYILKTDTLGNPAWERSIGGSGDGFCLSAAATRDGGYILAGGTSSSDAGSVDMYLVKIDSLGNQQWSRTFGGSGEDTCHSVAATHDGGYLLCGVTTSSGAGGEDMYIVKTDAHGIEQWSRTLGGEGADFGRSAFQEADGSYFCAGHTQGSFEPGGTDPWLVKLAPEPLVLSVSPDPAFRGGELSVTFQFHNPWNEPIEGSFRAEVYRPDGTRYPPVSAIDTAWIASTDLVALGPAATRVGVKQFTVPEGFPQGMYVLKGHYSVASEDTILQNQVTFWVCDRSLSLEVLSMDSVVAAGDSLRFRINLANKTDKPSDGELRVYLERQDGEAVWGTDSSVWLDGKTVALAPYEAKSFDYRYMVPYYLSGDYLIRAVTRKWPTSSTLEDKQSLRVHDNGLSVQIATTDTALLPGSRITVTVTLENHTATPHDCQMGVFLNKQGEQGVVDTLWNLWLEGERLELAAHETERRSYEYTVPGYVRGGEYVLRAVLRRLRPAHSYESALLLHAGD